MKSRLLLALSSTLLLSSCGGGSDFSGGSTDTGVGLGLTSANAMTAAGVAYSAASGSVDLANVGGSIGVSAGSSAPISPSKQLSGFLVNALQQIPFGPDVFPCAVSGSMTLSGDIADPLTLSAGDTFTIQATACDDGIGEIIDGLISMTVTDFTGDLFLGTYLLGMDATLDGLQVTTASDVISSTGDTSITLDTTAAPFVAASVSGASMMTSSNASTETLSNYSTEQTVDAGMVPSPYTLTSSGTVDSSQLADSVRLIALDNVDGRIELDNDGNGSVDETIDTTWAALANQAQ